MASPIKSLSSISAILSTSTHHLSFLSQIFIYSRNFIFQHSSLITESTFFSSSYLRDFDNIKKIIQYLKNGTSCQDLCIEQLGHRAKLGVLKQVISFIIYNKLVESIYSNTKIEKNTWQKSCKKRYLIVEKTEAFYRREKEKK